VTVHASARSISRFVAQHLRPRPAPVLEVLAVFERVCDLVSPDQQGRKPVIALVTPEIGDGPLNVVLNEGTRGFTSIKPGMRGQTDGDRLDIGGLAIELGDAEIWEPRPDWPALRAHAGAIATRLPMLRALSLERAPADSLLALMHEVPRQNRPSEAVLDAAQSAANALQGGWSGHPARLREGASQMAGLGPGLTPGGDDFLCGTMLWAWLAHSRPDAFCRAIAETAAPRTTTLSAAFLWAAARGECSAAWHALLDALAEGNDAGMAQAAQTVLTHGATSGADALAGFLWAGAQMGFG
jgi:hypothetical protein